MGVIFGLPSLRLRGLYLAVSTLALHFIVIYLGGEYETKRGFSTGIIIDPPAIGGFRLATAAPGISSSSVSPWPASHLHQSVAQPDRTRLARDTCARDGGRSARHQRRGLQAARLRYLVRHDLGCGRLFAYYRGFVSVEAFSLFLSIQYVAMIIIGGMGSLLGALLGAVFVTIFPYVIEAPDASCCPMRRAMPATSFAVNYAAFGVVMILFLVLEPLGLVGIWHRLQNYFLLWPFKQRPLAGPRK